MDSQEVFLDTDKLEAKLNRSDFAQVIFQNVAETYPPNAHVECHYTLTASIQPNSRDWVGLYKVGWTSSRDYHTFNYAPVPTQQPGKEMETSVLFSSYYLPKEDGEFYQFVYVNRSGEVKGASTPFQFKTPSADDFIEIEDENTDMLLIKTKTAFCEERLTQANEENARLIRQLRKLEDDLKGLTQTKESLEKDIEEQKKNYTQLEGWYKKALSNGGDMEQKKCVAERALKKSQEVIQTLTEEKEKLELTVTEVKGEMDEYQDRVKELTIVISELEKKIQDCQTETDTYKEHFQTAEGENMKLKEEIVTLREQLSQTDSTLVKSKEESQLLYSRIDEEKKKFERQLHVTEADKTHMRALEDKLKNSDDKIAALEDTKKLLTEEIDTLKQVQENMSRTLEMKSTEADNLKTGYQKLQKRSEQTKLELKEEIKAMRDAMTQLDQEKMKLVKEIHRLDAEQEGPLFALQQVNKHLKDKHDKLYKKYEDLVKQRDDLVKKHVSTDQERSDLQREVEDLRERLDMGAAAWTEKYKECKKLETKVKKLRKNSSSSGNMGKQQSADEDIVQEQPQMTANRERSDSGTQIAEKDQHIAFDSVLHTQLSDLEKELMDREQKCQKYKKLYQEEKTKAEAMETKHCEKVTELKKALDDERQKYQNLMKELEERNNQQCQSLQDEVQLLREELGVERSERQKKEEEYVNLLRQFENSDVSLRPERPAAGDVAAGLRFPNPYEDEARELRRQHFNGNPDQTDGLSGAVRMANVGAPRPHPAAPLFRQPIRNQPLGHPMFGGRHVLPPPPPTNTTGRLPPPPPNTTGVLPQPRNTTGKLPPPLEPEVLPSARQAAIRKTAGLRNTGTNDDQAILQEVLDDASLMSNIAGTDDVRINVGSENNVAQSNQSIDETVIEDRDDGLQEFHDAPEYPEESAMKWCPECHLLFPPSCPQDTFDQHVESHSGRVCPMCKVKFPKDPDAQESFERHVQQHFEQDM
ncbi:tax1-binding protein 1 homolog B-like [Ptychodera flava]|uniref:tax1-binding protein 1 homolog B-like n=1 Tax=Ptychodera flava TaxID=63121 RepID=UPI00396A6A63